MKILIDMNLSPEWVDEFKKHGIAAVHWTSVGKFDAPDVLLMEWARNSGYIIFTHDLDFGTALALTNAEKPSVIQVRTQDVTVTHRSEERRVGKECTTRWPTNHRNKTQDPWTIAYRQAGRP